MFYIPKDEVGAGSGLPFNPFNAIVAPRPIAWISTRGADGSENLAPYSFFNAVAYTPPQVMFASTSAKADRDGTKDTVANARETGVFCINIVEYAARDAMNDTSGPWDATTDEFTHAGLDRVACQTIACSRVADAPAALECQVTQIVQLAGEANFTVFGEVTGVHMRDACIKDGRFDITTFTPLARMGYQDYTQVTSVFALKRPGE
ncbi:flavin reductase family protein [Nereida sp. MMG025]|uniref:flavin reductase family protein n=1 Tax=Nereida sp. MMG025 TaxID=2909981 RepID=UPI001F431737|nr:flavin reductase family protein [Nereida sp. MMG025]MCF6445048.1 flavin reductase family protein [Nereida sp. MMG025]